MTPNRWILTAALLLPLAALAAPKDPEVRIDPRADADLRRMSNYLTSLKSARVDASSVTDLVTQDGQKIQAVADQKIAVKPPSRFRSERRGPVMDATVRYDGKQLSVYGKRTGYYALAPAPANLTETLETMRSRYGIEAPAGDLFVEDPYATLMEDVTTGRYVGSEPIDGVPCSHLAFQGKNVDFQLWIEEGPKALPRRYSIISKNEVSQPEFAITLSNWETNVPLPDSLFDFHAPPGSTRIEFQPVTKQSSRGGDR